MFSKVKNMVSKNDYITFKAGYTVRLFTVHMESIEVDKFLKNNNLNRESFKVEFPDVQLCCKISDKLEIITNDFSNSVLTEISVFGDIKDIEKFVEKNKIFLK